MLLICYKNAAGKVCRWFQPPKGWTREDLINDLKWVNEHYGGNYRAYARAIRNKSF